MINKDYKKQLPKNIKIFLKKEEEKNEKHVYEQYKEYGKNIK